MATAQANFLASYAAGLGESRIFILGDLNSYGAEDPILALEDEGYRDLLETYQGPESYSYTFDGEIGRLDYILGNAAARASVVGVGHWHINTDEPAAIDYDQNFNPPGYYTANEFRASDHDIAIAGLDLDGGLAQDQAFEPMPDTVLGTTGGAQIAQTFTATGAGALLQLELLIGRAGRPRARSPCRCFARAAGCRPVRRSRAGPWRHRASGRNRSSSPWISAARRSRCRRARRSPR
jgi:hypothetical protein